MPKHGSKGLITHQASVAAEALTLASVLGKITLSYICYLYHSHRASEMMLAFILENRFQTHSEASTVSVNADTDAGSE